MGFVRISGLPGKVYVPEIASSCVRKHPCIDCCHCQGCGEDRCRLCRVRREEASRRPHASSRLRVSEKDGV